MASNYDVTMKQYNGTDYDKLYPKDISQQILLNDNTVAQYIALTTPNPTILEAISKLQDNIYFWGTRCEVVSYTGDGTNSTKSISFSLIPKIVICIGAINSGGSAVPMISRVGQIIMCSDILNTTGVGSAGFQRIIDDSSYQAWTGWKSEGGKTFYFRNTFVHRSLAAAELFCYFRNRYGKEIAAYENIQLFVGGAFQVGVYNVA